MHRNKILLDNDKCKICRMDDKVYMWRNETLVAHYDGEKLYLASSEAWNGPGCSITLFFKTTDISTDVPCEKVAQSALDKIEDNIDPDTMEAIEHLRV